MTYLKNFLGCGVIVFSFTLPHETTRNVSAQMHAVAAVAGWALLFIVAAIGVAILAIRDR